MNDDERKIRELVSTWMTATAEGDLARILKLMADDVVFLTANQPPMRGKAAFAASFKSLAGQAITPASDIQEVRVSGDHAYVWNHLTVTVTPKGGKPVKRAGNVLSVFEHQADGRWVILRDANLLTPISDS